MAIPHVPAVLEAASLETCCQHQTQPVCPGEDPSGHLHQSHALRRSDDPERERGGRRGGGGERRRNRRRGGEKEGRRRGGGGEEEGRRRRGGGEEEEGRRKRRRKREKNIDGRKIYQSAAVTNKLCQVTS